MKNHDNEKYYIKFEKGKQTNFLRSAKKESFSTWRQVSEYLSVNRRMVFLYLSEQCKLPRSSFNKLIRISKLNPASFSYVVVPSSLYGHASIPQTVTEELAEFVGIMLGDGNISKQNYQITVSGGTVDGAYITNHVSNLIKILFSKRVYLRKTSKNGIECKLNSKLVCEYLTRDMDLRSPKVKSSIPTRFYKDHDLLRACIRGLFDTDGGLHRHHTKSAQLQFTNKSHQLILSLKKALEQLNFKPSRIATNHVEKATFQIYLFGKDVLRYFEEIGSNNPKNNLKFRAWVKYGKIPLNRSMVL